MNKYLRRIRIEKGMALTEVVVAAGIMGVVALGVASVFQTNSAAQSGIEGRMAASELQREIDGFLNNKSACTRTFGVTNSSPVDINNFPLQVGHLSNAAGAEYYLVTDAASHSPLYGDKKVELQKMTLQNFVHLATNRGTVDLVLQTDLAKKVLGPKQLAPKTIKLRVELAAPYDPMTPNLIVNCQSQSADSLWTELPTGDIYYSGGNVGVGSANPTRPLQIESSIVHEVLGLRTQHTAGPVQVFDATNVGGSLWSIQATGSTAGQGAHKLAFFDTPHDLTPQLILLSNGRVGIGKLDPDEVLDVAGNIQATTFYYSSDRNLKKDIEYLSNEDALAKVSQLRAASYRWKKTNESSIGVIAQDVEGVVPSLVHHKGNGELSVNYSGLTALTLQSVKALKYRNQMLAKEVGVLAEKNRQLEEKLSHIDELIDASVAEKLGSAQREK